MLAAWSWRKTVREKNERDQLIKRIGESSGSLYEEFLEAQAKKARTYRQMERQARIMKKYGRKAK